MVIFGFMWPANSILDSSCVNESVESSCSNVNLWLTNSQALDRFILLNEVSYILLSIWANQCFGGLKKMWLICLWVCLLCILIKDGKTFTSKIWLVNHLRSACTDIQLGYKYTIRYGYVDTDVSKKVGYIHVWAFIKYVRYMSVCLCNGLMVHKTDDDNILLSVLLFCI